MTLVVYLGMLIAKILALFDVGEIISGSIMMEGALPPLRILFKIFQNLQYPCLLFSSLACTVSASMHLLFPSLSCTDYV